MSTPTYNNFTLLLYHVALHNNTQIPQGRNSPADHTLLYLGTVMDKSFSGGGFQKASGVDSFELPDRMPFEIFDWINSKPDRARLYLEGKRQGELILTMRANPVIPGMSDELDFVVPYEWAILGAERLHRTDEAAVFRHLIGNSDDYLFLLTAGYDHVNQHEGPVLQESEIKEVKKHLEGRHTTIKMPPSKGTDDSGKLIM